MTKALLKNAWGYQGDSMNLPVENVDEAALFYESVMGFRVESRSDVPHNSAVLERDGVRVGFAENGGDSSQDGCAFEVENVEGLYEEFKANGLAPRSESSTGVTASISPELKIETRDDGSSWKVFFVIAPDGLCYWFGEKQ